MAYSFEGQRKVSGKGRCMSKSNFAHLNLQINSSRLSRFRGSLPFLPPCIERVYYPGCGIDVTPSEVFPESSIIYADMDLSVVSLLRENSLNALVLDANEFAPLKPMDVVIVWNSGVDPEVATSSLRLGGCLLCNDYFRTARKTRESNRLKHIASIEMQAGNVSVETTDLDAYWQVVDTEESFLLRDEKCYCGLYRSIVETYTDARSNYLETYTALLNRAESNHRAACSNDECNDVDDMSEEPLFADPNDSGSVLFKLPMKRGGADTLFVFKRVE
jgi:hypothetical protein